MKITVNTPLLYQPSIFRHSPLVSFRILSGPFLSHTANQRVIYLSMLGSDFGRCPCRLTAANGLRLQNHGSDP